MSNLFLAIRVKVQFCRRHVPAPDPTSEHARWLARCQVLWPLSQDPQVALVVLQWCELLGLLDKVVHDHAHNMEAVGYKDRIREPLLGTDPVLVILVEALQVGLGEAPSLA